jgi:hypothetical protein
VVGQDGRAALESCEAGEALCAAFAVVLARARFEPARRDGRPVPARVRVTTRVHRLAGADANPNEPAPPFALDLPERAPPLGVRAEVARTPAGSRRLELVELRDVPGTLGDPFRVLESMPGVVPLASGMPYYYVRGAPPAGTLYVYDGIQLPILFHVGVGPAVVHPRMLGPLRLYPGAAPARYGRMVGGVITTEATGGPVERPSAEVELRLLDVNGYAEAPIGDGGSVRAAVRWGWPALMADLVWGGAELFYGDYQTRIELGLTTTDRVEIVALGSYDDLSFTFPNGTPSHTLIHFHRLEARLVRRAQAFEIGAALRLAYDRTRITGTTVASDPRNPLDVSIEAGTVGPRLWAGWRGEGLRLVFGGELFGTFGRPDAKLANIPGLPLRPSRLFTGTSTRSVGAAWMELGFLIDRALEVELGGRFDTWITGSRVEGALDPRARLTWHVTPEFDLHAGGAVARQPAVFYVPMPGLSEVSLENGLQTAIQADVGGRVSVGAVEGELSLFVHHYDGLMFTDAFVLADATRQVCAAPGGLCVPFEPDRRTSGLAWGGELFLRIAPEEKLSGWISYTLSWIELEPVLGLPYRPSFDVRHVLNLVARWEILPGLSVGGRIFLRSGAAHGAFWVSAHDRMLKRHEQELDAFFRADASVAYAWDAGWARLRLSLEWLNVTIAREQIGLECPLEGPVDGVCPVVTAPPVFAPNLGLRGEFR